MISALQASIPMSVTSAMVTVTQAIESDCNVINCTGQQWAQAMAGSGS